MAAAHKSRLGVPVSLASDRLNKRPPFPNLAVQVSLAQRHEDRPRMPAGLSLHRLDALARDDHCQVAFGVIGVVIPVPETPVVRWSIAMSSCNRRTASGPGAQGSRRGRTGRRCRTAGLASRSGGRLGQTPHRRRTGGRRASSFQPHLVGSRRASATLRAISAGSVGFLRRRGILDFLISMMKGFGLLRAFLGPPHGLSTRLCPRNAGCGGRGFPGDGLGGGSGRGSQSAAFPSSQRSHGRGRSLGEAPALPARIAPMRRAAIRGLRWGVCAIARTWPVWSFCPWRGDRLAKRLKADG